MYLNTELGKQVRLLLCNPNTIMPTPPKESIFTQHISCSLVRLIANVRGNLINVCCLYRIWKCDGSQEHLNKSVQGYLGTDYPTRTGLRTESFPNTSHSQGAVSVIPCMSCVTGEGAGVPAPLELTPAPGQLPRQQELSGCSRDSSTYTAQQSHWCGALAIHPFPNICGKIIISLFHSLALS